MLLLDYWPLGRFQFGKSSGNHNSSNHISLDRSNQGQSVLCLVLEKVPFFVLSGVSSFLTIFAQQRGGTVGSLEALPLDSRIANALISYVQYIGKMVWPHRFAIFYPYPDSLPIWQVAGAGLLLACVSVLVIYTAHKRPYLTVGWLWYLGTLVPVIGLVQVGSQAMADRYTYVPLIGLFMMIAWGGPGLSRGWQHRKTVFAISAGILFPVLMIVTWMQVQRWQNSITLFKHTIEVTSKNSLIHYNLAVVLLRQGRNPEAIAHFNESLRIDPNRADAHNSLGVALARHGKIEEAMVHYAEALRIKPDYAEAHFSLALVYLMMGNRSSALEEYKILERMNPDLANNLHRKLYR